MGILELFIIAIGLSMDAFAVAMCTGLSIDRVTLRKALTVGLYFGVFQALMPLAGYLLGAQFASDIAAFDHWIAFVILLFIGGKMLKESFASKEGGNACEEISLSPENMLPRAIATSIDALAMGVSFAVFGVRIIPAISLIGITTLFISMAGVLVGHMFGSRFKVFAERLGGGILILLGSKILLEHLLQ
ncbi:MAG: manganese efflux pump MntP family protein [Oscillospiraceae bacterium]|jgi:putative Mn2+ efflux pump MntP|nr:manganese efflux pump MntP family protein [Oscillospiraceae bacterium]